MTDNKLFKSWLLALAATVIGVVVGIRYLDQPIAQLFRKPAGGISFLGEIFAATNLIAAIASTVLVLALLRLVRGHISQAAKAVMLAGCTAIGAYTVNDVVLKHVLGRQAVSAYLSDPLGNGFHLLQGTADSSFPSGHAVLAAAALSVIAGFYPRFLTPIITVMTLIGALLLIGDWHFLSDVLAGIFVGATAGLLVTELWKNHLQHLGQAPDAPKNAD